MDNDLTLEASSEVLRLALPLMSKYRVPVTPRNFTVWFDYAAGVSSTLTEAIDGMIEAGSTIDNETTGKLYERFYGEAVRTQVGETQGKMERILATLFNSLSEADNEVSRYEDSLKECSEQLGDGTSPEQIRKTVEGLIQSTDRMHQGNASLQAHLEESRNEAAELREELEKIKAESKTDPLTSLLNRKGFETDLNALQEDEDFVNQTHSVLIADIDKFKSINDTYGHLFGDKIIKVVATALSKITKGKDLVARFGGEEFLVFLPDTSVDQAQAVAENIRKSLERGRVYNPKTGEEIKRVTISIGVSAYRIGEEVDQAVARADEALYRAKENGRNRVELAEDIAPQAAAG